MNLFQDAVTQSTRDWPSDRFESLWQQVVVAAPTGPFTIEQVATMPVITRPDWGNVPASAWVQITGKLEQRTPMGSVHPDGEEWFVRTSEGNPITAGYSRSVPCRSAKRIVPASRPMIETSDPTGYCDCVIT